MVYLLHFKGRINARHTCQHYLGYAEDVEARNEEHKAGHGARLTQVARERGIDWVVVRIWPGGRAEERRLKRRKKGPALCPICSTDEILNFTLNDVPELAF